MAVVDSSSKGRQKQSLFGKAELEKEDIENLQKYYYGSYFYDHLLNFSGVLRVVCDLSDLWYVSLTCLVSKLIFFSKVSRILLRAYRVYSISYRDVITLAHHRAYCS